LLFVLYCRHVQQPGHVEPDVPDVGQPPADAEHAVRAVHAVHDGVDDGQPGTRQPDPRLQPDVREQPSAAGTVHPAAAYHA